MDLPNWSQLGLHVLAKPTGPVCNIRCDYCFYLAKEALYPRGEAWKMTDETLRTYVRQYIEAQPSGIEEIDFAFQGGEPTLMGVDFFRRAIELQKEFAPDGVGVRNSLQTNGILLDDSWCEFLKQNGFLVGLSMDGPADLHDKYRRDRQGKGTFDQAHRAMKLMAKHGVEFNVLACVNRHNGDHGARVYHFFRDEGIDFLQFIPIVEPLEGVRGSGGPPPLDGKRATSLVTDRSVRPKQFGQFLNSVFDEWVRRDVGRVFIRDFDQALAAWCGAGASLCVYTEDCGRATAIEHNGDLYSCDHFVDPEHKLGNIHETTIAEMANSSRQEQFGREKSQTLPDACRGCSYLFACNGACPKDRIVRESADQTPQNYLCEGFQAFFTHVEPYMKFMAEELRASRPASGVMQAIRAEEQRARPADAATAPRRNGPCPCGSGRKYKSCCLRR